MIREYLAETTSTNDYIKKYLPYGEDAIVCAERQTAGRGTKGRSFLSGAGGVYLTALTFYHDLPAAQAFRVMTHAAVAVCRTAEFFGASPEIKWSNDVLLHGRKLCGILIENEIKDSKVISSIVGIGLNVKNDVSSLGGIAASLAEVADVPVEEAREKLIESYLAKSTFEDYLARVKFLGKEVKIIESGREYVARARAIAPDGRLEIEESGGIRLLSSAEIRLKIL